LKHFTADTLMELMNSSLPSANRSAEVVALHVPADQASMLAEAKQLQCSKSAIISEVKLSSRPQILVERAAPGVGATSAPWTSALMEIVTRRLNPPQYGPDGELLTGPNLFTLIVECQTPNRGEISSSGLSVGVGHVWVKVMLKKAGTDRLLMHGTVSMQASSAEVNSREMSSIANDIEKKVLRAIAKEDPSLDPSKGSTIYADVSYSLFETGTESSVTETATGESRDNSWQGAVKNALRKVATATLAPTQ